MSSHPLVSQHVVNSLLNSWGGMRSTAPIHSRAAYREWMNKQLWKRTLFSNCIENVPQPGFPKCHQAICSKLHLTIGDANLYASSTGTTRELTSFGLSTFCKQLIEQLLVKLRLKLFIGMYRCVPKIASPKMRTNAIRKCFGKYRCVPKIASPKMRKNVVRKCFEKYRCVPDRCVPKVP